MAEAFFLEKVSQDPEMFWIRWPVQDAKKPGLRYRSTESLSESAIRAELTKLGIAPERSDLLIQQAREKFAAEATAS